MRPLSAVNLRAVLSSLVLMSTSTAWALLPAFPGAQGEGKWATGGRGGDIYHVTNLNDYGAGSLRYGLDTASGPRTIVFDVAGTIISSSRLNADSPGLTIAGQTAPGKGIVLRNYGISLSGGNGVMRHIRVRPGDAVKGPDPGYFNDFAIAVDNSNMIVDHCSTSWAISQEVTIDGRNFNKVTLSNSIVGEGLDQTGLYHAEWNATYNPGASGHHANGVFVKPLAGGAPGNHSATVIGNLLVDNHSRNPAPGVYNATQSVTLDFVNNVIYNCRNSGYNSGDLGGSVSMNYIGNYLIAGPSTESGSRAFDANNRTSMFIYQSSNKRDTDKDLLHDGYAMSSSSFQGTFSWLSSALPMEPVTVKTADQAYTDMLAGAGAFYWNRDSVDERLVGHVTTRTGDIIDSQNEVGGYPIIPVANRPAGWDTDSDGMPNYWEAWYGTDEDLADQNGKGAGGYTHIERYLEYILAPSTVFHFGDLNGDNAVNVGELGILAGNWGATNATYEQADFNGDGVINVGDLGFLAGQWGWTWTGPLTPPTSVPEPATLSLLTLAGLAVLRRHRR